VAKVSKDQPGVPQWLLPLPLVLLQQLTVSVESTIQLSPFELFDPGPLAIVFGAAGEKD
jgi:hypothetical protein